MGTATQNQAYQYQTGDRPLEGFTVQRGVGRGAFGEVYYALSDSGREVALKSVLGYEQIELRGVTQCMNLKSPYLVNIFDIRRNDRGQNFVLMEYVAGPNLRELLNDAPSGLGTQKAAFFLREIGKGLTYLHERGIVHRDLKPGNIFYEDGYVKIGDYGLSKAIAPSQHSGQTITVGTVHYMAPEIGQGRYDRSIDIYALGVLLFEMLTGHVPFFGASHGEILMKHLMEAPDLSGIDEPFATVIRKAMAKEPNERYQSVQEMVEAVFGAEHIQQSVSVFRPESLSMVAERAARKMVATGGPGSSAELANDLRVDRPVSGSPAGDSSDIWLDFGRKIEHMTEHFQRATDDLVARTQMAVGRISRKRTGEPPAAAAAGDGPIEDPMTRRQRRVLAFATAGVIGMGTAFLSGRHGGVVGFAAYVGILGGSVGLVAAYRRWLPKHEPAGFSRRLMLAVPGFLGAVLLSGIVLQASRMDGDAIVGTYAAAAFTFLIMRWDKIMAAQRRERVMLGQAVSAGVVAFAMAALFQGQSIWVMGLMAGIALVVQIASPFTPVASGVRAGSAAQGAAGVRPASAEGRIGVGPASSRSGGKRRHGTAAEAYKTRVTQQTDTVAYRTGRGVREVFDYQEGPLPVGLKIVWLCALVGLFGLGLFCAIASGITPNPDAVVFLGGALACAGGMVVALSQLSKRRYFGIWGNLIKPLLLISCLGVAIFCGIALTDARPGSDDALILAFFTAFCAAAFLALLFVPKDFFGNPARSPGARYGNDRAEAAEQNQSTAILLSCLGIFGVFGLHRFYVGKIGTGLLYFFTAGLFFVGQIYDFFLLISGEFTDAEGRKLRENGQRTEYPPEWKVAPRPAAAMGIAAQPRAEPSGEEGAGAPAVQACSQDPQPPRHEAPLPRYTHGPRRTSFVLSALAYAFLIPAVVIGLGVAFQVPFFLKIGMPFPDVGPELDKLFNYAGWPNLVMRIGTLVAVTLLIVSAMLLAIARREAGVGHVARAVLGNFGLFLAGSACVEAFGRLRWVDLIGDTPQLQKLEIVMNQVESDTILIAAAILIVAIVLMVWPERRRTIPMDGSVHQGVAA